MRTNRPIFYVYQLEYEYIYIYHSYAYKMGVEKNGYSKCDAGRNGENKSRSFNLQKNLKLNETLKIATDGP